MPQQITRGPTKSGDAASIRVRKRASPAPSGPSETASSPIQAESRIPTHKPDKAHKPSRRQRHAPRSVKECERLIEALTADLSAHERKEQQLRRYMDYLTLGQLGTVADITQRKHREESLGSMQAELARASRAITLGQLMASIAHEVNQPLAALVANANAALRWLAWKGPQIEKARQALERIVRDGNRASEIIARIRGLLRRSDAQRDPLSLNSVIHEVTALLKAELRGNNITVRTNLAEQLPPILGDRVQMQQVLLNLIMNAIEAMSGVVTRPRLLTITTTADVMGVAVAVEDRGIGIDVQALERIFEPFYSNKPQGMGIGLAISRSIIEAHGGRLWAVNKASGASFRFRLPAAAVHPT